MSDSIQPRETSVEPSAWDDPRITAFVMGELSEADRKQFETAIANNEDLRQAVDQAEAVKIELRQWFANETPKTLDKDRRDQILAASTAATDVEDVRLHQTLAAAGSPNRFVPWLLAAAASLILALGLLPALKRSNVATSVTQTTAEPYDEITPQQITIQMERESGETIAGKAIESKDKVREQNLATDSETLNNALEDSGLVTIADASGADPAGNPSANGVRMSGRGGAVAESPVSPEPIPAAPPISRRLETQTLSLPTVLGEQAAAAPASGSAPAPQPSPAAEMYSMAPESGLRVKLSKVRDESLDLAPGSSTAPSMPVAGGLATKPMPTQLHVVDGESTQRGTRTSTLSTLPTQPREPADVAVDNLQVALGDGRLEMERGLRRKAAPFAEAAPADEARLVTPFGDSSRFESIVENEFQSVAEYPLSTFSIDVDTASYSKVRRTLAEGRLPSADAVRIEELVNYFDYDYDAPEADSEQPFATQVTIAGCPWNQTHRLARVAIQGKTVDRGSRPPCNLVFLLDTSGSMNQPNKLPLVIEGMKMLTQQLSDEDRVAIVVYAGSAGMVLDSTPAKKKKKINKALTMLAAGGSTNGAAGIQLAYATARDHFITGGINRVILCTDGDFNVGTSGTEDLVRLVQEQSSGGIFLTALGFGMDNHNDAMMEQISGKGNGNYAFIDTANEARKVLVRQTDATLVTIAKDVKLQIEFNRRLVSQYRLIGYENRVMAKEDFNDDQKDAGEIGAGHQVTAFYELVMAGPQDGVAPAVDPLKYQRAPELTEAAAGDEVMTVKLRYKQPDGVQSKLIQLNATDSELSFNDSDNDFQFAASVASFAMLLRQSKFAGDWTLKNVREVAQANRGEDEFQLRAEFVQLVSKAIELKDR